MAEPQTFFRSYRQQKECIKPRSTREYASNRYYWRTRRCRAESTSSPRTRAVGGDLYAMPSGKTPLTRNLAVLIEVNWPVIYKNIAIDLGYCILP